MASWAENLPICKLTNKLQKRCVITYYYIMFYTRVFQRNGLKCTNIIAWFILGRMRVSRPKDDCVPGGHESGTHRCVDWHRDGQTDFRDSLGLLYLLFPNNTILSSEVQEESSPTSPSLKTCPLNGLHLAPKHALQPTTLPPAGTAAYPYWKWQCHRNGITKC